MAGVDKRIETTGDKLYRCFKTKPRNITFQVTEACNYRCTYCYQHKKSSKVMDFDVAKQLIDQILTNDPKIASYCASEGYAGVVLDFIGGEPFLAIDLIDQITDYFIRRCIELRHPWATRYHIMICSNGELYFSPKVQKYIQKNLNHLCLNITVDGNKELHDSCRVRPDGSGTYDQAIAAVTHWRDYWGRFMDSKLTVSPDNIQYLSGALIDMLEFGYDDIHFNPCYEEGWTLEHARQYYRELKKLADYLIEHKTLDSRTLSLLRPTSGHPLPPENNQNFCGGANGHMLAVNYKGELFPCLRYMESSLADKHEPYTIGSVQEGITRQDRVGCLNCITRRSQSTDECFNCPIASGCGWCSAYNYETFGTPNKRTTFLCDMHKGLTLALCYLWNNVYIQRGSEERYSLDIPKDWALQIVDEQEYEYLKSLSERS